MKKVILLRDHSEESELAESILKRAGVDFVQIFCCDGRLPSILSSDSAYAFEGIGGVRLFVS